MTVNELIERLQRLAAAGYGELSVRAYSSLSVMMDGYEPIDRVEFVESNSTENYVRID